MRRELLSFSLILLLLCLSLNSAQADTSEYSESLRQVKTGEEMLIILQQAKEAGVDLDVLPAPPREALRHYFGEHLFYNFKPELFWPHYPDNWRQGMRNVYRHALEQDYKYENRRHAIEHLNIFFNIEQMGKVYLPAAIRDLSYAVHRKVLVGEHTSPIRIAQLRFWVDAVMATRNPEEQLQVVKDIGIRILNFYDLRDWFQKHPDFFIEILQAEDGTRGHYSSFQRFRTWFEHCLPVPIDHPVVIRKILDNPTRHNTWLLAKHIDKSFPDIKKEFYETDNLVIKNWMCFLMVKYGDKETENDVIEHLWALLADRRNIALTSKPYHVDAPGIDLLKDTYEESLTFFHRFRIYYAMRYLIDKGDIAAEQLLTKLNRCKDPQQLALSLLVIQYAGAEHRIPWNDSLVDLLVEGLKSNDVRFDQGIASIAIIRLKGSVFLLEGLKRHLLQPLDLQQEIALNMLIENLEGPQKPGGVRHLLSNPRYPLGRVYAKEWLEYFSESTPEDISWKTMYWEFHRFLTKLRIERESE